MVLPQQKIKRKPAGGAEERGDGHPKALARGQLLVGDCEHQEDGDGADHIPGEIRADTAGEQLSHQEPDVEPMLGQPREKL